MRKPPFVRSAYNYDVDEVSSETGLACEDLSLTVQSEADDADINTIVRRFGLTGAMPQNVRVPMTGDFSEAGDYHSALNALIAADEAFAQMPADVRARFKYDPAELIRFVENPDNYEEATRLGIVNARAPSPAATGSESGASAADGAPNAST